jgi:glycosyltransferase involved in cell wall biosynthesis
VVERLLAQFPNQVRQFWLEPREVPAAMAAGDYGLLLREPTITNRVAAPVKFAEYLACGLPVICSDCIGDCAEFLKTHKAGFVVSGNANEHLVLSSVSVAEKLRIHALAEAFYSKRSETIKVGYSTVAEQLR